ARVARPALVPFAVKAAVTGAPAVHAACWASSRIPFSFVVISSASRWMAPRPNTCGALRLIHSAGFPVRPGSRITLLPVSPAPSPPPRLWQLLHELVSGPVIRFGMWLAHSVGSATNGRATGTAQRSILHMILSAHRASPVGRSDHRGRRRRRKLAPSRTGARGFPDGTAASAGLGRCLRSESCAVLCGGARGVPQGAGGAGAPGV